MFTYDGFLHADDSSIYCSSETGSNFSTTARKGHKEDTPPVSPSGKDPMYYYKGTLYRDGKGYFYKKHHQCDGIKGDIRQLHDKPSTSTHHDDKPSTSTHHDDKPSSSTQHDNAPKEGSTYHGSYSKVNESFCEPKSKEDVDTTTTTVVEDGGKVIHYHTHHHTHYHTNNHYYGCSK